MLIGTDVEAAMTNAIDQIFPEATMRLCTKHIKDNLLLRGRGFEPYIGTQS